MVAKNFLFIILQALFDVFFDFTLNLNEPLIQRIDGSLFGVKSTMTFRLLQVIGCLLQKPATSGP